MSLFRSRLIRNSAALYAVQGLQYIIPVVTLPWLVRALGTDGYGMLNTVGAAAGYLQVLCDYGFHLTATSAVASAKSPRERSEIVASVLGAKLFLAAVGALLLAAATSLFPPPGGSSALLLLASCGVLASSFFPSWLFQGAERMEGMAAIAATARLSQLLLVILLVHSRQDLPTVLIVQLATSLAGTIAGWLLAFRLFRLQVVAPSFRRSLATLVQGFEVFLSQVGSLLFANTNILVLSACASPESVGSYAIAEKIIRMGVQIGGPVGTALFPRVTHLLGSAPCQAWSLLRRVAWGGGAMFALLGLGLVAFANPIVRLAAGKDAPEAVLLVRILSILPLSIFLDNLLGTQVLLNLGRRRIFLAGTLSAGVAGLSLQALLVPRLEGLGAALSLLLAELWILAFFFGATMILRPWKDSLPSDQDQAPQG